MNGDEENLVKYLEAALVRQAARSKEWVEASFVPGKEPTGEEIPRKANAKRKADQERSRYPRNRVNRRRP
jgi:hypothetical protein